MSPETVMSLSHHAMLVALMLAAPLLLAALAVGLLVSLFQAATQINEMTLSFIPKILGVCIVIIVAGPWMLSVIVNFASELFRSLPALVQ